MTVEELKTIMIKMVAVTVMAGVFALVSALFEAV